MRLFRLHGCTSSLDARSSVVFWINFSGILVFFYSSHSPCLTALFGIASSPFSNTDSIQFTTLISVQYYVATFLALGRGRSVPIFATFLDVNYCSLSFSFMICASDKLYLKTLGQRPRTFVDKTNTNEFFFLTNPAEKRWHSLDLWWGLLDAPPPPPESVRTAFVRTIARWRDNQIFSAWWVINFFTHGDLLARFSRTSSANNKLKTHRDASKQTNRWVGDKMIEIRKWKEAWIINHFIKLADLADISSAHITSRFTGKI